MKVGKSQLANKFCQTIPLITFITKIMWNIILSETYSYFPNLLVKYVSLVVTILLSAYGGFYFWSRFQLGCLSSRRELRPRRMAVSMTQRDMATVEKSKSNRTGVLKMFSCPCLWCNCHGTNNRGKTITVRLDITLFLIHRGN